MNECKTHCPEYLTCVQLLEKKMADEAIVRISEEVLTDAEELRVFGAAVDAGWIDDEELVEIEADQLEKANISELYATSSSKLVLSILAMQLVGCKGPRRTSIWNSTLRCRTPGKFDTLPE